MMDFNSIFERLPPQQKTVFALMLMYGLPGSITSFTRAMSFAKLRNPETGKNLSTSSLGEIFSSLKGKGLIEGAKGEPWRVAPVALHLLRHEFVRQNYDKWLPKIQTELARAGSTQNTRYWSYQQRDDKRAYMEGLALQPLRLIFYHPTLSPEEKQKAFTQSVEKLSTSVELAAILWANVLDIGERAEEIWNLLDDNQKALAFLSRRKQVLALKRSIDSLAEFPMETMPTLCRLALAELYFLVGRSEDAGNIIDIAPEPDKNAAMIASFRGVDKFFKNDKKGAIAEFEYAVEAYKKLTRKRKYYFPYAAGAFYVLAMIQVDIEKYRGEISQFLKAALNDPDQDLNHYRLLELVFQCEDEELGRLSYSTTGPNDSWLNGRILDIISFVVFVIWSGKSERLKESSNWLKVTAVLKERGFHRLQEHLERAAADHKEAVFARPAPAHEDWQRALSRLRSLTDSSSAKNSTGQRDAEARLVWMVSDHGYGSDVYGPDVVPKLQKRNKSGVWSKGRNVSLKRLVEGDFSEAELSPQDLKVIGSIEASFYHSGWGTETSYEMNAEKALPALAGHPAVIGDDGRPVEISLTSPDLVIQKNGSSGYQVSFSKPIPSEPGIEVHKLDDHRYEVLEVSDEHCQINRKIGKTLVVPEQGVKELQELVPQLAPLVPVQSDLAGAGAGLETVNAEDGLHVRLSPSDEGFVAEFLVEPIAGSNKFFHPGKGREHLIVEMGKRKVHTARDLKKEKRLYRQAMKKLDFLSDMEVEPFQFFADGPHRCLELLEGLKQLEENDVTVTWPEGEKLRLARRGEFSGLSLDIKKRGTDWFSVDGEIRLDDSTVIKMNELLRLLEGSSSRFLSLGEEGYLALEQSLYRQLKQLSGIAEGGKVHALAAPALAELGENAGKLKSTKYWRDLQEKWESSFDKNYAVPTTLQADLRDYQAAGFRWLARLSGLNLGACLADDMGLGKTLQALAVMLTRAAQGPALVVAPVSVVPNWISEIGKFAPTLNVKWMIGSADKRKQILENLQPFDVVLCSYGVVAPDQENLSKVEWDMVVLDEAQAIKNHTTKRANAAFSLNAKFRLVTTGTPMENHLGELWSIFKFISPGFLGSFNRFNQRFINPIEADTDSAPKQHLKTMISPFILRRKKTQVLEELPEKTEITLSVEMSKDERAFYEALRVKAMNNLAEAADGGEPTHVKILAEIMRLRRFCCHPKLVDKKVNIDSAKLAQLQELLLELREGGHKVLIFSQFVDHLSLIREWLDKTKISYQYLDGSTPAKKRQKAVQDFQNGAGECFLISLKAGGAGLNLTAANYVIHMDPWWNPAVEDQASDRAHRIGQKQPVTIYRLVVRDTIEEKILSLHKAKRDLADSLLEGADQTGRISTDELLALLSG